MILIHFGSHNDRNVWNIDLHLHLVVSLMVPCNVNIYHTWKVLGVMGVIPEFPPE